MANLHRMTALRYTDVPRHYQEAVLMDAHFRKAPAPAPGRGVRESTLKRFRAFLAARAKYGKNRKQARMDLAAEYGDTYFYYCAFGLTMGGLE